MVGSSFNVMILVLLLLGWAVFFWLLIRLLIPKHPAQDNPLKAQTPLPPQVPDFSAPATSPTSVATAVSQPTSRPVAGSAEEGILLAVEVPKENEITPLAAELMFASLHGIYRPEIEKMRGVSQERVSFELQAKEKSIRFFVWVPKSLHGYVEGQIYAQYPGVNVTEIKDYSNIDKLPAGLSAASAYLNLTREDIFPIISFISFEVDPLAAITSTLSKLAGDSQIWVQILTRPENDHWRNRAIDYITAIKTGRKDFATTLAKNLTSLAGDVFKAAISGGAQHTDDHGEKKVELSPGVDMALKEIEAKSSKLGFKTMIRIVALDTDPTAAQQKLDLVVGSFKQFNSTNLNGFIAAPIAESAQEVLGDYVNRRFNAPGYVLNVAELASIYHLPSQSVTTPNIVWAGAKKGEPPATLPLVDEVPAAELTPIGITNFRGTEEKFGIKIKDRRRHVYIIGKSGSGKSVLLQNMTLDDINEGRGVAVVDPHGDYVDYIAERIPSNRIQDVVLFDPNDKEFPIAFNILEVEDPKYKVITASGVVGVFKKIFGESWGPRLEYWLSSAVLALLDYPNATLMMIPQLFVDRDFRDQVIAAVQDPIIKSRWINEYNKLDQKQQSETISPILNKVGQFLSTSIIRNVVGQPNSSINVRSILDDGKILLVKLTKGLIGEDNAALLGALIVTKIQLAAMSRADIADATQRKDFFLYVDEFQNFATDAFATILSEARKYGLCLTVAHQYIAQLSEAVSKSIFGNVGTIISFRVGADDGAFLKQEFMPTFDEQDLVNLNIYNIYLKLSIDGVTANAFSAGTLPPSTEKTGNINNVIQESRKRYGRHVDMVQKDMQDVQDSINAGRHVGPVIAPAGQERPVSSPTQDNKSNQPESTQRPQQEVIPPNQPPQVKPVTETETPQAPMSQYGPAPEARPMPKPKSGSDVLKGLISKIEKTRGDTFAPEDKKDVKDTLVNDLPGATGFGDAFKKAQEDKGQSRPMPEDKFEQFGQPRPPVSSSPQRQPYRPQQGGQNRPPMNSGNQPRPNVPRPPEVRKPIPENRDLNRPPSPDSTR